MVEAADRYNPDARRGQWLKGILDLCVLALIGEGSSYGYDLATSFEAAGLGTIKGGTLYPRLTAMEKAGLLASEWKAGDGGPGRKYYRVTSEGAATLNAAGPEWHRFTNAAAALIPSTNHHPPPPKRTTPPTQTTGRKTKRATK